MSNLKYSRLQVRRGACGLLSLRYICGLTNRFAGVMTQVFTKTIAILQQTRFSDAWYVIAVSVRVLHVLETGTYQDLLVSHWSVPADSAIDLP